MWEKLLGGAIEMDADKAKAKERTTQGSITAPKRELLIQMCTFIIFVFYYQVSIPSIEDRSLRLPLRVLITCQ